MEPKENQHHPDGPSTLKHKAMCPGWTNTNTTSAAAEEGTMLHERAETGDPAGLDAEQVSLVQKCLDYLKPLETGALKVLKEHRVELPGVNFGTADRIIYRDKAGVKWLHVVDFKFGRVAVDDAEENLQGFNYLLAAALEFPEADRFAVHFLMPRRDEVTRAVFARADLPRLRLAIDTVMKFVRKYRETSDASMLCPSVEACGTCGTCCPRIKQYAVTAVKSYAPLEVVENFHSSEVTDPKKMGVLVSLAPILERMAGSIKEHSKILAAEQGELVDEARGVKYVLAEKAGARKIEPHKSADAVDEFRVLGLSDSDLLACSSLSLSKCLDLLHDRAPRGKKAKARGAAEAALAAKDIITEGTPSKYLKKVKLSGLTSEIEE